MANTRDIRSESKELRTRQITRAMQMVATSKMKRHKMRQERRPYAMLLADVIVSVVDELRKLHISILTIDQLDIVVFSP